mmetsp:Transcript_2099/g.13629  ORF Transcript_2099/g.13629 Transcript_2099/m.13629 type:complete len:125 (+) Transcript_2099:2890-3264(+)
MLSFEKHSQFRYGTVARGAVGNVVAMPTYLQSPLLSRNTVQVSRNYSITQLSSNADPLMSALSPSMQYARIFGHVADSWCFILPIRLVRLSLARLQASACNHTFSFPSEICARSSSLQLWRPGV